MNEWEEENSVFLAKWLNNELSEEERLEFEKSQEGKTYLKLLKATDKLELSPFDVDQAYQEFSLNPGKELKSASRPLILRSNFRIAIAASLAAILAVTYFLTKPNYTVISTGVGESMVIVLPGGSAVTMNANSEIKYQESSWDDERNIFLNGEAFFEVKKGNDFIVRTGEGNIKVLGTSFNIRARDDDLDVTCYTGKVNVSNRITSVDLTPGNSVRIENKKVTKEWNSNLPPQSHWINGIIVLDDVSTDVVLDELKHQFGISIVYDGQFDTDGFKLSFSNDNMGEAVRLVMSVMNLEYSFDESRKQLVIEGKK